jgi:hypothetical protein
MLNEINQTYKDKYCTISLICGILKSSSYRKEEWNSGYKKLGRMGEWREDG